MFAIAQGRWIPGRQARTARRHKTQCWGNNSTHHRADSTSSSVVSVLCSGRGEGIRKRGRDKEEGRHEEEWWGCISNCVNCSHKCNSKCGKKFQMQQLFVNHNVC